MERNPFLRFPGNGNRDFPVVDEAVVVIVEAGVHRFEILALDPDLSGILRTVGLEVTSDRTPGFVIVRLINVGSSVLVPA